MKVIREAGSSRAREERSLTELGYPCREPQLSRSWLKEAERVRFGIADVVLGVLVIILLVLFIRQLIY